MADDCRRFLRLLVAGWMFICVGDDLCADEITVQDDAGQRVTVDARWVAEGKGAVALERRDGRWEVVPRARVVNRVSRDLPPPLTAEEIAERLSSEFAAARLVSVIQSPYLVSLVAERNVATDKTAVRFWEKKLREAGGFLKSTQGSFQEFARAVEIELAEPKFPLVVLIFENDQEFDAYFTARTEGNGLSAEKINSYYDLLTNRLVLRLRECHTYDTPLHESIHQLAHNFGALTRLAPVPAWFNEGLATGFEGDGKKVKSGPKAFNRHYAGIALRSKRTTWNDLVREDKAFQGDVLAGEAYAQAWGMHWWLLTRYSEQYRALLRHYSSLEPLTDVAADQRLVDFEQIVGRSPSQLEREFDQEAAKLLRRK